MLPSAILIAMPASIRHSAAFSPGVRKSRQDANLTARGEASVAHSRHPSTISFLHQFKVTNSISYGFHVNAGYVYPESSTPNASFSPAKPGSNANIFSVGSGRHLDSLSSALARPSACAPTGAVSLGTLADATHAFDSNAILISLGHYF